MNKLIEDSFSDLMDGELILGSGLKIKADEDKLSEYAYEYAELCERHCHTKTIDDALETCTEIALAAGIEPPTVNTKISCTGAIARLSDPRWWLRKLRKLQIQTVERLALHTGIVSKFNQIYVSDATLKLRKKHKSRNRHVLESLMATNEDGEEFNLSEIIESSLANPKNRRAEMMCRIAGYDEMAQKLGNIGVFYTFTCPSRMHARLSRKDMQNPRYNGTTPIEAHGYLNGVWRRIRAELKRRGIVIYGIRVVEPQHDGTPHWHLLLFHAEPASTQLDTIIRRYNLEDSPNESGAKKHRVQKISIDPDKGTAVGYIAKYVSKNIDGAHLETDLHGNDAATAAERVEAWASTWGIRQFQFLGGPPVSVWRELRRLNGKEENPTINKAFLAADSGEWAKFMIIMGGVKTLRNDMPIKVAKIWNDQPGKYGEAKGEEIIGIKNNSDTIKTRHHTWTLSKRVQGVSYEERAR